MPFHTCNPTSNNERQGKGIFTDLIEGVNKVPCQCFDVDYVKINGCVCNLQERVLRAYANGMKLRPMADDERAWCIEEAVDASEGSRDESQLTSITDQNLAKEVLSAWKEYAQSQGLL